MDVRALGDCLLKEEKSFAQRWFARSSKIELMDLFCLFSRDRDQHCPGQPLIRSVIGYKGQPVETACLRKDTTMDGLMADIS